MPAALAYSSYPKADLACANDNWPLKPHEHPREPLRGKPPRGHADGDGQAPVGIINDGSDRVIDVAFTAGATTPLRRYTHSDNIDEPLQLETFDAAGAFDARYSYHADHLGSIRFLTDALVEVVNAYDYDSYGQETAAIEGVEQPFRFTGREWDEAAKLYHYRARAYDPSTGMFIQEDPIWFNAGDLNVQRYVGSNPINATDPSGKIVSTAIMAGERAAGLSTGFKPVADGIKCLFTNFASIFEGLNDIQSDGEVIGKVILGKCASQVIAEAAPAFSDDPNDIVDYAKNSAFSVFGFKALKRMLPVKYPRPPISPTAKPAYVPTWKGQGPDLSR